MNAACPTYTSAEDYLIAEEDFDWRREWCDGAVYEMPRSSIEHGRLGASIGAAIANALGDRATGYASSTKLYIEGAKLWTYADGAFVCGSLEAKVVRRGRKTLAEAITNPTILVEVLADETERYDRDGKFQAYKLLPSFEEYVLVSQHEPSIEVYRRGAGGGWSCETAGAGGSVTVHGAKIAVDDVYA